MLNKLINYIKDDEVSVFILKNKAHVLNYVKVMDISSNKINIKLKDNILSIEGSDLLIRKLDKRELLIVGFINKVTFND